MGNADRWIIVECPKSVLFIDSHRPLSLNLCKRIVDNEENLIWDYMGQWKLIPRLVLLNAISTYEDWLRFAGHSYDRMPEGAGEVFWDQTVSISTDMLDKLKAQAASSAQLQHHPRLRQLNQPSPIEGG